MPRYSLAHHVFVCRQDGHVVFLDVKKDRYFALPSAQTAGLADLVPGWPVDSGLPLGARSCGLESTDTPAAQAADADTVQPLSEPPECGSLPPVLELLLEQGILISSERGGKSAVPVAPASPETELIVDELDDTRPVKPIAFLRFVRSAIVARLLLKHRSFEYVVKRVHERNLANRDRGDALGPDRLLHAVAAFAALRPFFFTVKDECLFDALALSEFLSGYRVFPQWIFGVQARPFAAHCWLQLGNTVLNDTVEHVRRYAPIMAV